MGGLTRGWALVQASWRVLMADQELLLFPVLSAICTVIAIAVFVLPAVALIEAGRRVGGERALSEPESLALLFVFYLVTSFVALFFNTALVGAALERMRGGSPNVGTGFRIALQHLPAIFVYALIAATVGLLLRLLERRGEFVEQILAGLFGAAWSIVTFLVVPVMVVEGQNPFAAIRRSFELLRQTWGAQIVGNLGVGLVFFLLSLLGLVPLGLGLAAGAGPLLVAGLATTAVYWALLAVVGSALSQVFRAAVYVYAATGSVPSPFEPWMMQQAFRAK